MKLRHTGLWRFLVVAAVCVPIGIALSGARLFPQTRPAKKPSFDVTSVKPRNAGTASAPSGPRGDSFRMSSATLRALLAYGYGPNRPLLRSQIISAPDWWETDQFDVQGKADCTGGPIVASELRQMVQSLLEDRFQLKAHFETRELPVYSLVVRNDRPNIKRSEDQTPPIDAAGASNPQLLCVLNSDNPALRPLPDPNRPLPRGTTAMNSVLNAGRVTKRLRGAAVPIIALVRSFELDTDRPVVDKTGLTGLFDYEIEYSIEPATIRYSTADADADRSATSTTSDPASIISSALNVLGLRLESSKAPIEVLVIETVQKPTGN
jgi:uncharacterized protein (TIGR03435 family)